MNDTKPSPFGTRRTQIAIAAILVVGALSAALILRSGPDSSSAKGAGGQGHSEAASHADTEHHGEKQSGDHKDEKDMQMVSTMMKRAKGRSQVCREEKRRRCS